MYFQSTVTFEKGTTFLYITSNTSILTDSDLVKAFDIKGIVHENNKISQ